MALHSVVGCDTQVVFSRVEENALDFDFLFFDDSQEVSVEAEHKEAAQFLNE